MRHPENQVVPVLLDIMKEHVGSVILQHGEEKFLVDKKILAERSDYFRLLLTGGFQESTASVIDMCESPLSFDELKILLLFLDADKKAEHMSLDIQQAVRLLSALEKIAMNGCFSEIQNQIVEIIKLNFLNADSFRWVVKNTEDGKTEVTLLIDNLHSVIETLDVKQIQTIYSNLHATFLTPKIFECVCKLNNAKLLNQASCNALMRHIKQGGDIHASNFICELISNAEQYKKGNISLSIEILLIITDRKLSGFFSFGFLPEKRVEYSISQQLLEIISQSSYPGEFIDCLQFLLQMDFFQLRHAEMLAQKFRDVWRTNNHILYFFCVIFHALKEREILTEENFITIMNLDVSETMISEGRLAFSGRLGRVTSLFPIFHALKKHGLLTEENFIAIMNLDASETIISEGRLAFSGRLGRVTSLFLKKNFLEKAGILFDSIDPDDKNRKVIFDKFTFSQFNEKLKMIHGNGKYNCLATYNNGRGIVVELSEDLYVDLRQMLGSYGFQFGKRDIYGNKTYFVSTENVEALAEELIMTPENFGYIKTRVCAFLEKYISSYKLSIFGHHHNQRAITVRNAIMSATTLSDIRVILENQKKLFEAAVESDSQRRATALLGSRFAGELKNKPEKKNLNKSTFYKAICNAKDIFTLEVNARRYNVESSALR